METLASEYSASDIAEFLSEIELPQYAEAFENEEISGDLLLTADPETLADLGVTSPLHQLVIVQQFRKKLQTSYTGGNGVLFIAKSIKK